MPDAQLPFDAEPAKPSRQTGLASQPAPPATLTVSHLVARIKEAMLDAFDRRLAVVGQISNFKRHTSGHLYFSLKDAGASIDAVMFKRDAASVRFDPEDGLEVVAEGRVDVYERQGRLQFYVERIAPRGTGALELALRQLKRRLERDGLFDSGRKVAPARFPRAVGVITSPTGAAIRDVARTLRRRWPGTKTYLFGVRVQGDRAAGEIAEAIGLMDAAAKTFGIDTIILARGGGSLEDLWAFNEEIVARAIFSAKTPIITGIGHEVDFTIADFTADVRAATPTAAAELAVPDRDELDRYCRSLADRLGRRVRDLLKTARVSLRGIRRSAVFGAPAGPVRSAQQTLDELTGRMISGLRDARRAGEQRLARLERDLVALHPRRLGERAAAALARRRTELAWALGNMAKRSGDALAQSTRRLSAAHPKHRLGLARQKTAALERQLDAMSYRAVLRRGYSVTRMAGGEILRSSGDASPGDWIESELADGRIASQVGKIQPDGRTPRRPLRPETRQ